jgi:hypothetical protein
LTLLLYLITQAEVRDGQCYCLLAGGRRAKQQEIPLFFLMTKTMHVSLFFFLFENYGYYKRMQYENI